MLWFAKDLGHLLVVCAECVLACLLVCVSSVFRWRWEMVGDSVWLFEV